MYTATLNFTLDRVDHDMRAISRMVNGPGWLMRALAGVASWTVAGALRRASAKLSGLVLGVVEIARYVEGLSDEDSALIDASGLVNKKLLHMLDEMKEMHGSGLGILGMAEDIGNPELTEATRQLTALCAEAFEAVARLHWVIAEHDASLAKRLVGYTASTPEDVAAMLERIAAEE
ncbi:MAG: hypothetical protein Q8O33_19045 [Pseudomonadota bacterium]|nr:hypothetical protein [Pseudomonadota bacterium]